MVKKHQLKKKRVGEKAATRSKATRVLAQGAGAVPRKAFGAGKSLARKGWKMSMRRRMMEGLNARLPMHLGLPRPVGPYQVIRTTTLHTTSAAVVIFAPLRRDASTTSNGHPVWYHACGLEDAAPGPINGGAGTRMISMPLDGIGSAAGIVPAALTVQVMNKASLQQAEGLFTMGRVSQQLALGGETRTWEDFTREFNSYFKPRLLTGAKLALRGVTCNAVPINMNEFSD